LKQRYLSYSLFILILALVLGLPGCGGGGSTNTGTDQTVAKIEVSPIQLSMEFGQVTALRVTALNANDVALVKTFTFKSDNTALVNVSTGGNVCAGTWDTAFVVCTPIPDNPATPAVEGQGTTTITVTVDR